MREDLWNSLLDAEMNIRYWDALIRRYTNRDRVAKWLLSAITSGTAASLALTYGDQMMWRVLAATGAIVSLGLSIFDAPAQVRGMADLHKAWAALDVAYHGLWLKLESGCDDTRALLPQYLEVRDREVQHRAEEGKYPRDVQLIRRCQAEVLRARGLRKDQKDE